LFYLVCLGEFDNSVAYSFDFMVFFILFLVVFV